MTVTADEMHGSRSNPKGVVVSRTAEVEAAIARIEAIGYRHNGDQGIAGREALKPPDADVIRHHLYVVVEETLPHLDHFDLRDHLRTHPDDVARYAERKREVAHLYDVDPQAYVDAKAGLIEEMLSKARRASE